MSVREEHELLIVDGYNVMHATARYEGLIDGVNQADGLVSSADAAYHMDGDPFIRAREALISDVATFAHHRYKAVIVFDGAGNVNPERPNRSRAGVKLIFSKPNQSADTVIEKLVTEAREAGRSVSLVTSDKDVRSTVGFGPGEVTRISSAVLVRDVEVSDTAIDDLQRETGRTRMTLEDRLSPEQRQRLWNLLDQ